MRWNISSTVRCVTRLDVYKRQVGGTAALIIFFGAGVIAKNIMAMSMSVYALRVLAPCILIVAILGAVSYTHLDVYKRQVLHGSTDRFRWQAVLW